MSMSVLERRLQVLVDQQRFALLERESRRTGRSIGSIVREALDEHFVADDATARRRAAAARLLAYPPDPGPGVDWGTMKTEYDADLESHLG